MTLFSRKECLSGMANTFLPTVTGSIAVIEFKKGIRKKRAGM